MSEALDFVSPAAPSEPAPDQAPEPLPVQRPREDWSAEPAADAVPTEQPGSYDLTGIELHESLPWDSGFQGRMVDTMRSIGLSADQVVKLVNAYSADQGGQFESLNAASEHSREIALQDLRSEWGTSFDSRLELARQAFTDAVGTGYEDIANLQLADGGALGDHPAMVKAFAALGGKLKQRPTPGTVPTSTGSIDQSVDPMTMTPQQAADARLELTDDPKFMAAWMSAEHPRHAQAVQRMHDLAVAEVGNG